MANASDLYGGFTLKKGDSDKKKIWSGKHHTISGNYVALLQTDLKNIGVYLAKIDGDFGMKTHDAVKRFQWNAKYITNRIKSKAITPVTKTFTDKIDGIVGNNSKKELILWINTKYIVTGDLVRIKESKFSHIELGDGFKVINHPNISAGEIVVSSALVDCLKIANEEAKALSLKIFLNQSMRLNGIKVSGAVVTPASKSQHLIGHAIDCNIVDGDNWNSSKAFKEKKETENAKKFISALKENGMRWGGNFSNVDTPHFDKQVQSNSFDYDCKYFFNQRMVSEKQTIPLKIW
ncbi:MAG: M15 family metallopeptidase [Gammaproteobacteria bacterium]|nr:M15 family metallopeptidase [Gammaproteobacteria bacterium]MCW9030913.1 M15 family metallopeptidase [Gammaproteobacteria bacterium]